MLFRVCEHYDFNDQPIIQKQKNECFICFEYKTNFENRPTNLQKQKLHLITPTKKKNETKFFISDVKAPLKGLFPFDRINRLETFVIQ